MKRRIVVSALLFTALMGLCLTEGRLYAMHVYGAPCGQASGFAGFLQETHFLPSGGCPVKAGVCQSSGACTVSSPVSGVSKAGKCTNVQGGGCTCLATR
jgi:hypothetical protein